MADQKVPLRQDSAALANSRQSFIQSLENKKQFEQDCAVIIPELDRLWKEKILVFLGYDVATKAVWALGVDETHTINWRHFLYNYDPQLLAKAITRLSSRLKFDPVAKTAENARGPVKNIHAYYKAIVQDMRKKDVKRAKRDIVRIAGDIQQLVKPYVVGQVTPWGLVVETGRITVFGHPPAYVMDHGVLHKVECAKCYDEEGSYGCVRPAHKSQLFNIPDADKHRKDYADSI